MVNLPTFDNYAPLTADLQVARGRWELRIRNLVNGWTQVGLMKDGEGQEHIVKRNLIPALIDKLGQFASLTPAQINNLQTAWATEDAKDP